MTPPSSRLALIFVVALSLASGCRRSPDPAQVLLPTQLAVVAIREGDAGPEPVSLVLDLRRNSRDQLDVRVAPGLRLWDGRHLWEVTPTRDARGEGLRVHDLKAGRGGDVPLFASTPLEVVGMTRKAVWVRLPNRAVFSCELARPECKEAGVDPLPMSHPGPGTGFSLELSAGVLELRLPFARSGAVLLERVQRLVGVHWVHETWLEHDALLDSTYRGRGTLTAVAREVTSDGDLRDWSDAEPMVVDAPWQVESGPGAWGGPRDASFSIAVARSVVGVGGLCFAGRVRDDDWMPADALILRVGPDTARVSLEPGAGGTAQVQAGWFSHAYELCLPPVPGGTGDEGRADVPFSVGFEDHDRDGTSVITSAPTVGGVGGGTLRVGS